MNNNLKVAAIQTDLFWENPKQNKDYFEKHFQDLESRNLDIVVLPEMFSTGFTMNSNDLAESMDGKTVIWMQRCAREYQFLITGSLIIVENNKYHNRMIFTFPDGSLKFYDKIHLFRMGNEHLAYSAGTSRIIIEYKNWRILPQICYDIRFPLVSYNLNEYDLLLYVANFPSVRRNVWDILLKARAIENQCYVIGCNRIGKDDNNLEYNGGTQIVSPKGKVLNLAKDNCSEVIIENLDLEELNKFREKFPVHLDGDKVEVV